MHGPILGGRQRRTTPALPLSLGCLEHLCEQGPRLTDKRSFGLRAPSTA